jgi:hypothetical protein
MLPQALCYTLLINILFNIWTDCPLSDSSFHLAHKHEANSVTTACREFSKSFFLLKAKPLRRLRLEKPGPRQWPLELVQKTKRIILKILKKNTPVDFVIIDWHGIIDWFEKEFDRSSLPTSFWTGELRRWQTKCNNLYNNFQSNKII